MIALLAVLLGLPAALEPKTAVKTEVSRTYDVFDAAGDIAMNVEETATLLDGAKNSRLDISFKTMSGVFVIHQTSRSTSPSDGELISVTISSENGSRMEFTSGSFESYAVDRDRVLEFPDREDAELTDGRVSREELAAFREAVPEDLRKFCELYVRTIDLIGGQTMPIQTRMARLGAPKGTKTDAADQGWYVRDEKREERVSEIRPAD